MILSIFSQSKLMNSLSESFIDVKLVPSAFVHCLKSISISLKSSLSSLSSVSCTSVARCKDKGIFLPVQFLDNFYINVSYRF